MCGAEFSCQTGIANDATRRYVRDNSSLVAPGYECPGYSAMGQLLADVNLITDPGRAGGKREVVIEVNLTFRTQDHTPELSSTISSGTWLRSSNLA